ncbi:MAG: CoA ester lyase [Paucimonas sp.]|nr:CoA ester lyase [Paucimonas sp.]
MADPSSGIEAIQRARTLLFVPGNRPDRFDKAHASGADLIIIDLDASVAPEAKHEARQQALDYLRQSPASGRCIVRCNAIDSAWGRDELKALNGLPLAGVMLAKLESAAQSVEAISLLGNAPLVGLVETAIGISRVRDIASQGQCCRLAFGNMDYATDLHLEGNRWGMIYPSSELAIASRCAGLPPPVAGATPNFSDSSALMADLAFEKELGFGAKLCIHPAQVSIANAAHTPDQRQLERARRILEASQSSHAINLDGEMVDRPVIEWAQRLLGKQ